MIIQRCFPRRLGRTIALVAALLPATGVAQIDNTGFDPDPITETLILPGRDSVASDPRIESAALNVVPGLDRVVAAGSCEMVFNYFGEFDSARFRGDLAALERSLRAFSETRIEERVVFLVPVPGEASETSVVVLYEWLLEVHRYPSNRFRAEGNEARWGKYPTITVYVADGADFAQLPIPRGIKLVGIDELHPYYL